MKQTGLHILLLFLSGFTLFAQSSVRYTYHDAAKKQVKEMYHVKLGTEILHGAYFSYYFNGSIESKGQFENNETAGIWEFFYESGNLKMRGLLKQNSNHGLWEYFYENGNKSMEGEIIDRKREGEWKLYYESGELREQGFYKNSQRDGPWKYFFENGRVKGEINYKADEGIFTEYYPSGKIRAEGPKRGTQNVGYWKYYFETSKILQSEGSYVNGKKNGEWKTYYPSGKLASHGLYINDKPSGEWLYFHEGGGLSVQGVYVDGQREGNWSAYYPGGVKRSETKYNKGSGEFKEFYKSGALKASGQIREGKNEGKWQYYFESGKLEGECEFVNGKGNYIGYYDNGVTRTKGVIEDDKRVGTWEIYDRQGNISGYYKPYYDRRTVPREVMASTASKNTRNNRGFNYFEGKPNEFKGVIIGTNPLMTALGFWPVGIEFYNDERLGHEFEFESVRSPFFIADADVALNEIYTRGYAIGIKQKFYNPIDIGHWYFGQEIRFTNLSHFSNIRLDMLPDTQITASASEQKIEYGLLLGYRLFQRKRADSFTVDAFAGYDVGFRSFQVDNIFAPTFQSLDQDRFSRVFRFGLNFGYLLSFDPYRR